MDLTTSGIIIGVTVVGAVISSIVSSTITDRWIAHLENVDSAWNRAIVRKINICEVSLSFFMLYLDFKRQSPNTFE